MTRVRIKSYFYLGKPHYQMVFKINLSVVILKIIDIDYLHDARIWISIPTLVNHEYQH